MVYFQNGLLLVIIAGAAGQPVDPPANPTEQVTLRISQNQSTLNLPPLLHLYSTAHLTANSPVYHYTIQSGVLYARYYTQCVLVFTNNKLQAKSNSTSSIQYQSNIQLNYLV